MKRKTNLFYNSGQDSNFLTFSNYTEAMTGNFVSTNTKLYPSRFLCIKSKLLSEAENKEEVKKDLIDNVLCGRYENKLAFLRDALIVEHKGEYKNTYTVESELCSLGYLLEALKDWDSDIEINYIGEISEQDFNGTYTDTICVIDTSSYIKGTLQERNVENIDEETAESKLYEYYKDKPALQNKLYGWFYVNEVSEPVTQFEYAEGITPVFDAENQYNLLTKYSSILLEQVTEPDSSENNIDSVEFNLVIPLFDIINNDYKSDIVTLVESDTINLLADGKADETGVYNAPYISNVPLGIWIAPIEDVVLKRDTKKKYAPTWSLVIGSQFKPFPYMAEFPHEISKDAVPGAYNTFAQILVNLNEITENITKLTSTTTKLAERITEIESTIKDCPAINNNMDSLRQEFLEYKNEVNNTINNFSEMLSQTELRWINREG